MAKAATVTKVKESKDLILPEEINPVTLFGKDNESLQPILERVKKEILSIVPDVSTAKGRKAITANVSRVTSTKTALDKLGKEHVAAQKEELKDFDKQRKHAFTFLEDLQKEARKTLTEWEDKEKERIAKCEGVVNAFIQSGKDSENWMNYSAEELTDLLQSVDEVTITKRLAEFEEEAEIAKKESIKKINEAIQNRNKYDEDQEELEQLRLKSAEDDRIRFEADQRAEAVRAAEQKVIDANNETQAAERRAAAAEEQRKIDAEEAETKRLADVEAATKAESDRIEAKKQAEIEAEKVRAKNKAHKGKINRAAMKAFIDTSKAYDSGENVLTEGQAKLIIKVIANNKVPNVKISY